MAPLRYAAKLDPFLWGAIQGKEGIKFCHLATLTTVAIRIWAEAETGGTGGTALTNFLWVFFGCPSGDCGDDRKRIFTEGWEGRRRQEEGSGGRSGAAIMRCVSEWWGVT